MSKWNVAFIAYSSAADAGRMREICGNLNVRRKMGRGSDGEEKVIIDFPVYDGEVDDCVMHVVGDMEDSAARMRSEFPDVVFTIWLFTSIEGSSAGFEVSLGLMRCLVEKKIDLVFSIYEPLVD